MWGGRGLYFFPDSLQIAGNAASGGFPLDIASVHHSSVRLEEIAAWAGSGMLKSSVLSKGTCICIWSSIQDTETVSSFHESEALQHNPCAGDCSSESRSPSSHPLLVHLHELSLSHTLGNCYSWWGEASIQIPEPSSKTVPHPLPPPHWAAIPGWCVDSHLSVTEGSLAGAWQ